MPFLRLMGIDSHRPSLDVWAAREIYERAEAELPLKSTREMLMRDAILSKLEWARGVRLPKTLAEILGGDA